jgi:LysR family transcriptional regulator, hydrogen peroxide-inducible genes activator
MRKLPSTRQLQYLIALDRYKHFGRAAESCFVSQPAFSVAIKELESLLNVQLADRTNKTVTITNIGQEIIAQSRLALRDIDGIIDIANRYQSPLSGVVRVGIIPTIAPFLLPKLLPRIRKAFPQLKLHLLEDQTDKIDEQLKSGSLDFLILALPYDLHNIEKCSLFDDPFHLAFHRKTRLFDPRSPRIDQLPDESILLLEYGHCLREQAMSVCKIRNVKKISRINANSLLTLIQMVDADLGVTYLPELALQSSVLKHTQVKTCVTDAANNRQIAMVWRRGSLRSDEFMELGRFIKENR